MHYQIKRTLFGLLKALQACLTKVGRFQFPVPYSQPKIKAPLSSYKSVTSELFVKIPFLSKRKPYTAVPIYGSGMIDSIVDYRNSRDNFFADIHGNVYLDLYCQGGSLPLGYNHDHMVDIVSSTEFDEYLLQKPFVNRYPPHDYYAKIRKVMAVLEPEGMPDIVLTGTSATHALELAIRNAVMMFNKGGNKEVSILTFEGASNGRSLGTLSLSQEEDLLKKLPSIEAVTVPFPTAKLPLSLHEVENEELVKKALENIKSVIDSCMQKKPIAAIVVEPILNRGNYFASYNFYKELRKLAKSYGIYFIINETHTGGGSTGKFWASELWGMEDSGDFLVFGKKCQVAGYYTKPIYRPEKKFELASNWNDVGWKLVQLEAIVRAITKRNLMPSTANTGAYLRSELEKIAVKRKFIQNIRGQGTFIGFDVVKREGETENLLKYLKERGINVKLCDENTIGLRPALILEPIHAGLLLKALNEYPYKDTLQSLH